MYSCSNSLIALITSVQQDIVEASDEAHWRYVEENIDGNQTKSGMRAAISSTMDSKRQKLNAPFTKHLAIANPHNGSTFLMEVPQTRAENCLRLRV